MLLMSVRLGIWRLLVLHHLDKAVEQVGDVVGSRACFRVALKGKSRHVAAGDALQGPVE